MKILLISDTHGKIDRVKEIYPKLKDLDLIIHLGDFATDAEALARDLDTEVLFVKGNMDGDSDHQESFVLDTEYGKIYVTHGHKEMVKRTMYNLMKKCEELDCKAIFYGHTHMPTFQKLRRKYLVNPGSISRPREGTRASYAIINTSPDKFSCSIVYYSDIIKSDTSSPVRKLKNMLNNSDRF